MCPWLQHWIIVVVQHIDIFAKFCLSNITCMIFAILNVRLPFLSVTQSFLQLTDITFAFSIKY